MSTVFQKPPKNYLYQVGLANVVDWNTTPVSQNGVQAAANLQSITIPASALVQDGQLVYVTAMGVYSSAGVQTILLQMNGNQILSSGNPASGVAVAWFANIYLMRRGNDLITTAICTVGMPVAGSAGNVSAQRGNHNVFTGFNFAADLLLQFQVTSGNAGDTSTQHFITSSVQ